MLKYQCSYSCQKTNCLPSFTSQIFICLFLCLEVVYLLLIHPQLFTGGSCCEAKLSPGSLEMAMRGVAARGLTLLFRILPSHQMVACW